MLDIPTPVLGMKLKRLESVIELGSKINLSMKKSRGDLSIDMVIHRGYP